MLICINPKTYSITKYKAYERIGEIDGKLIIRNDIGKKAHYSASLFKTVNHITPEEYASKVNFYIRDGVGTMVIDTHTGCIGKCHSGNNQNALVYIANSDKQLYHCPLNIAIFAWKLGICEKDERKEKPVRTLLTDIQKDKMIRYNEHPYKIKCLNGKCNAILIDRMNGKEMRIKREELLNNEKCYEG